MPDVCCLSYRCTIYSSRFSFGSRSLFILVFRIRTDRLDFFYCGVLAPRQCLSISTFRAFVVQYSVYHLQNVRKAGCFIRNFKKKSCVFGFNCTNTFNVQEILQLDCLKHCSYSLRSFHLQTRVFVT